MSKQENDNCSENSQSEEFACSSCPQKSPQEAATNRRSLRLKAQDTIVYRAKRLVHILSTTNNPFTVLSSFTVDYH